MGHSIYSSAWLVRLARGGWQLPVLFPRCLAPGKRNAGRAESAARCQIVKGGQRRAPTKIAVGMPRRGECQGGHGYAASWLSWRQNQGPIVPAQLLWRISRNPQSTVDAEASSFA